MPTMNLTSLRRLRTYVVGEQSDLLTSSNTNNRLLEMWIASVSGMIENFLNRKIKLDTYTEYFPLTNGRNRFWVKAYPIVNLQSVYEDPEGLWDGNESEISDPWTDSDELSVSIPYNLNYLGPKKIQITYRGGIASHPVQSKFTIDSGDSFTTDNWIIGNTSGARALVVSQSTTLLTIEDYWGVFEDGETLTEYEDEAGATPTGTTTTLNSISTKSLVTVAPELVMAAEAQIRYMLKHTTDFENDGTNRDGATLRRSQLRSYPMPLQREVLELLTGYQRVTF